MKFPRLSIRGKVVATCVLLLLFMGGFSGAMIVLSGQLGALALGLYDKTFVGMHYALKVQVAFARLEGRHTDADLPLTKDDDTTAVSSMINDLDVAADRAATPKLKAAVATAKSDLQALANAAPNPDRPTLAQVDKHIKRLAQRFADDAVDRRDQADGLIGSVRMTIFALAAAAVAGALMFAASLILGVVGPLRQVIMVIQGGDRAVIPPRLSARTDEIGQMVQAIAGQRDAARSLETERLAAGRAQQATAQAHAGIVASLSTGLGRLAGGDLSYRITAPFPLEFERLRSDFNQALTHLRAALAAVAGVAENINTGSDQISAGADELSRRSEQQAASLEETAVAIEQLTVTAQRAAAGALQAADMVQSAEAAAARSGPIVREALAAMEEIESSAQKIRKITGLLDEIAEQTNLLALNASIEAARAGEAGRGFAVVAQEVRVLAQRSAEAAKEINGLIQESARHVDSGVRLVQNTGVALDDISGNVNQTTGLVSDIAESSREQAETLNQVNVAVNQMDRMTQQNVAMVELTTAASHTLAERAVELLSLVREFDLGDSADAAVRGAA